jgi:hypothetical protein
MIKKYKNKLSIEISRYKAKTNRYWKSSTSFKVLFITENTSICNSQVYPFYFYKKEISRLLGQIEYKETNINSFENFYKLGGEEEADIVLFQPWFNRDHKLITALLSRIRVTNPTAKIVFLDSYAPLDLRFADLVSPLIDFYIKKQVFKDREAYSKSTYGDTSLVEYYNDLYGLPQEDVVRFNIPDDFMVKLVVGPSFFTSRKMLPILAENSSPPEFAKKNDVHARLGTVGTGWYQEMREHSLLACEKFKANSVVTSASVTNSTYLKELSTSRICFSPFGYGEVCWRDYEAIMCGALLIKPDMSHIETNPNIYIPFQTYIPVAWDFSDLSEMVNYYLKHEDERKRITREAYNVLYNYTKNNGFVKQFSMLFTS